MDILTTDISSLSFKCVKEKVDEININELYNSKELIDIINILKSDKRKNINKKYRSTYIRARKIQKT